MKLNQTPLKLTLAMKNLFGLQKSLKLRSNESCEVKFCFYSTRKVNSRKNPDALLSSQKLII